MKTHTRRCFFASFFYALGILIIPCLLESQEGYQIRFHQISIADTFEVRGLKARFPHPILSVLTIRDAQGRYVHGLADTTRWLGPHDLNQRGQLIDTVWNVLLEHHRDNPAYPPNPNIKDQYPPWQVTEVLDVQGYGLSVLLAMDYSGSMGDEIFVAEAATRRFIRQMSRNDEAALLKFTGKVLLVQPFTRDTTRLLAGVDLQPDDREYTALYDALYVGLREVIPRPGRRVLVAYTDGKDNASRHGIDDVIALARTNEIPVYLVGLGPEVDRRELQRITSQTGGHFWEAPTAEELGSIYLEILKLIRGYYILAHTSPDPWENGTWRVVDLTIRDGSRTGHGQGTYFVPFIRPNMRIRSRLLSDSLYIAGRDTLTYAMAGDTIRLHLMVTNDGLGAAPDVHVITQFPDSLDLLSCEGDPIIQGPDSIVWRFPRIASSETRRLSCLARVKPVMPMGVTRLEIPSRVRCLIDSIPEDDHAVSLLCGLGLPDLTVHFRPPPGTVSPGYDFSLSVRIENRGNGPVSAPFEVAFYEGEGQAPFVVRVLDGLGWKDTAELSVPHRFPTTGIFQLRVRVDDGGAIDELREDNNEDRCSITAAIDSLWIRVGGFSDRETIGGDTGRFPDVLLGRVLVGDRHRHPVSGLGRLGSWAGPDDRAQTGLPIGDHWIGLRERRRGSGETWIDVRPGCRVLEGPEESLSLGLVVDFSPQAESFSRALSVAWERFLSDLSPGDVASVFAIDPIHPLLQPWTAEPDLLRGAIQRPYGSHGRPLYRTLTEALSTAASRQGRRVILTVTAGEDDGEGHLAIAALVEQAIQGGVPLFFLFFPCPHDSLEILAARTGGLSLAVSDPSAFEEAFDRLLSHIRRYYAIAFATPDTLQDTTWREVAVTLGAFGFQCEDTGLYQAPFGPFDLRITKMAHGRIPPMGPENPWWGVQAGDTVRYALTVWNAGHWPVQGATVRDDRAENLRLLSGWSSTEPIEEVASHGLLWRIPYLDVGERRSLAYACFVDTLSPNAPQRLINRARVTAERDDVPENDVAEAVVDYHPLQGAILSLSKRGEGDSIGVVGWDTLRWVSPGGQVAYTLRIENRGQMPCTSITLEDHLPHEMRLETLPDPTMRVDGEVLRWRLERLPGGQSAVWTYIVRVDSLLPPWSQPLVNRVLARWEGGSLVAADTVWTHPQIPPPPQIRVFPALVAPGDTVRVEVMTGSVVDSWDLIVSFADGTQDATYADAFIRETSLMPGVWTKVRPAFGDTRMRTSYEGERVALVFVTLDRWGITRSDTAYVEIKSGDDFYLEDNLFRPAVAPLGLHFRLASNRWATITIYDVAGGFVRRVVDGFYPAGWNQATWDGRDAGGRGMGSGIYLAILSSGRFQKAHKFILVH